MKNRIWVYIGVALILVVAVPLLIDWLIIGNSVPSNISNSDWVGFLGEYIGTIIGFIVSLIGIVFTIRFTKDQMKVEKEHYEEQKRLGILPVLDCKIYIDENDEIDLEPISIDSTYTCDENIKFHPQEIMLEIYNIGVGAAINLSYGVQLDDEIQDGTFWRDEIRTIQKDDVYTEKLKVYLPVEALEKFVLIIKYSDVLGNKYIKRIQFIYRIIDSKKYNFEYLNQDNGNFYQDDGEQYLVVCLRERSFDKLD